MGTDMAFVHVLITDCTIVIWQQGVTCLNKCTILTQLLSAPGPKHLWYNIKEEQKAVCNKNKDDKVDNLSESSVEVTDSPWPGTKHCKKDNTHHTCY